MKPKPISEIQRVVDTVDKFREVHAGNENTYLFRLKDALDSISSALCVMNMKLEGKTTELLPQPVATGLCEDIEILLKHLDDYFSGVALESFKNRVRQALTAERKRAVLVDEVIAKVRSYNIANGCDWNTVMNAIYALDAFDKGAENG